MAPSVQRISGITVREGANVIGHLYSRGGTVTLDAATVRRSDGAGGAGNG